MKTALKGITQMHNFWLSQHFPGKVKVWNSTTDSWRTINLLKDTSWRPSDFREQLVPHGLTLEWHFYLFDKIGEFCPKQCQDLVCPKLDQLLV